MNKLRIHSLAFLHGFNEGNVDDFVVTNAYHDIALPLNQCCDGTYTNAGG